MTDFRSMSTIGERIKFLRKARGIKSTNELADMTGGTVSAWTLQNLESGRKADVNVATLLNIAMTLKVAPTFLLAPMARPHARLDIPDLVEQFAGMSVAEFDAWFSGLPEGATSNSGADRNERRELQALRELGALLRERRRLSAMLTLEGEAMPSDESARSLTGNTARRLTEANLSIDEISEFLETAGWDLGSMATGHA